VSSSFDVDQHRAEVALTEFDAARSRLEAHGWELVRAGEGEFAGWKRLDTGVMHEISLPDLSRLEAACAEYDAAQEARAGAARERSREHERLERQTQLEAEIDRSVREAAQRWAAAEAAKDINL
jgi:hypothetical protein